MADYHPDLQKLLQRSERVSTAGPRPASVSWQQLVADASLRADKAAKYHPATSSTNLIMDSGRRAVANRADRLKRQAEHYDKELKGLSLTAVPVAVARGEQMMGGFPANRESKMSAGGVLGRGGKSGLDALDRAGGRPGGLAGAGSRGLATRRAAGGFVPFANDLQSTILVSVQEAQKQSFNNSQHRCAQNLRRQWRNMRGEILKQV